MRVAGMRWTTFFVVALVVAIAAGQAMAVPTVVVPDGLDDTEGNVSLRTRSSDAPRREQQIYNASEFDAGPITIYGYRLRPDGPRQTVGTLSYLGAELVLSTTSTAAPLSLTYADNTGADAALVFSGDIVLSTNPTDPVGPNAFDMEVLFDTPFAYDPSEGNLLVDLTTPVIEGDELRIDAEWIFPTERRIIWSDPALEVANNGNGQVLVREFIIPEPSSLLLTAIGLLGLIGCGWRRKR